MRTCDRCGRVGERGFWTQIRQYPEPNRTLCNNQRACDKRQKLRGGAASEVVWSSRHDGGSSGGRAPEHPAPKSIR